MKSNSERHAFDSGCAAAFDGQSQFPNGFRTMQETHAYVRGYTQISLQLMAYKGGAA